MDLKDGKEIIKTVLNRLLPSLLVLILSLLAFNNGVYLEHKPNICAEPLFVQIYYAIGLFLLAGIDFGMPVGGSEFYRFILYISYFLAPLITVLAVIEAVLKTIGADYLKRPYKNHVVIIGANIVAIKFMHSMQANPSMFSKRYSQIIADGGTFEEYKKLIVVEKDPSNIHLEYFRELSNKRKVDIIIGDIDNSTVFNNLNIRQAQNCIINTNDDILNLDIALKLIHDYGIKEKIIVQLESEDLIYFVQSIQQEDKALNFRVISVDIKLANCFFFRYIQTFLFLENLVIFGFGRFGQHILELISTNISFKNLIIIDPDAEQKYKKWIFKKKLYNENFNPSFVVKTYNNKQEDSQIIESIKKKYNTKQWFHFVMCTEPTDYGNIKLATILAESFKNSIIYLRSHATLYEKLIGIDSRNCPYGLGCSSNWTGKALDALNEEEKLKKVIKNKFIYGGYLRGTIESNFVGDVHEMFGHTDNIEKYKKFFSKVKHSNIHLFNELAELKNEHEFFNDAEFQLSSHWKIDGRDGFLKLNNFNKDSEGNQIFSFKID
tara:strand:- start:944 stop:2590 length:1647 start_codon:yes stop_codon:yes gene_type:complete